MKIAVWATVAAVMLTTPAEARYRHVYWHRPAAVVAHVATAQIASIPDEFGDFPPSVKDMGTEEAERALAMIVLELEMDCRK